MVTGSFGALPGLAGGVAQLLKDGGGSVGVGVGFVPGVVVAAPVTSGR